MLAKGPTWRVGPIETEPYAASAINIHSDPNVGNRQPIRLGQEADWYCNSTLLRDRPRPHEPTHGAKISTKMADRPKRSR